MWQWVCRLFGVPVPRITLEAHDRLIDAFEQLERQLQEGQRK